jgi:hypothetical protein
VVRSSVHPEWEKNMDEMIIETSGPYRVRVEVDAEQINPRTDWDHITYAVTVPGSRYLDVAGPGPLAEQWDRIKDRPDAVELFQRWARAFHGAVTEVHTPNEGPVSVWYMMPEDQRDTPDPVAYLRGDIAEYQAWAEGDVFSYVIEKAVDWGRRDGKEGSMTTWETVDSLGSFYGYEEVERVARDAFKPYRGK